MLRAVNNKNTDHVETKACGSIQVWLCSTESLTNALIVKYFKLQFVHVCMVSKFDFFDNAGLFTPLDWWKE